MSGEASARGTTSREMVSEERLQGILSAIADGIIIVDQLGIVRFANPAALALLGREEHQLIGQVLGFPLVVGETTEIDLVRSASSPLVVEMRVVEMRWNSDVAFLASLRDITDRRDAEQQRFQLVREQAARERAEAAVRARDEFLSVAAHELKTPVTRIRLATQLAVRLMERGDGDLADIQRRLQSLDNETDKLSRLVLQLLDVSRIETGKLSVQRERTDLTQLVRSAAGASQASTDHHVVRLNTPKRLVANVDPLRFEQIVTNLLDNAVKYSPHGGDITVELQRLSRGWVKLTVTDQGVGIAPEHRKGIFERFYQAHAGSHLSGLGVGLYITRQIVELHGGQIEVAFPPGGGTCFVVTLPSDGGERPARKSAG